MSIEAEISEVVRRSGWFGANVSDGEPPFLYSIGLLQTFDHPELIVFGLEPQIASDLLSRIVQAIRDGQEFADRVTTTIHANGTDLLLAFRKVHRTKHPLYLGYAMGYCRRTGRWDGLEALQVYWPDNGGKFPFDVGFDSDLSELQPRLDIALTPTEIAEFERQFE